MLADLPTAPWFRRLLVSGLILGILLLTFSVLQQFCGTTAWRALLAYAAWPMHSRIMKLVRGRSPVASLITSLIVTVIIVVPLVWLILMLRVEAVAAYGEIQDFLATKPVLPQAIRDLPYVGAQAQEML